MKFTNELNLPEALFRSLSRDYYRKQGDFTASEIPTPTQIWALRKRYNDEIVMDVSDLIYPLIGSNTHYILERAGVKNALVEERLFSVVGLWNISGQLDFYFSDNVLWDYKISTMWVLVEGCKPEWEFQLNINSLLLEDNGFDVDKIKICCLFRDWSKIQALTNPNYLTKKQVAVLNVRKWDREKTENSILNKIEKFVTSEGLPDNQLPQCTPYERWERPTKYAVMKNKNKRATKLFDNEEEAVKMAETDKSFRIEKRIGESVRCEYYCEVKDFCQQYKQMKN